MEQHSRVRYPGFVALYGFWTVAVLSRAIVQYVTRLEVALPTHLSLVAGIVYLAITIWAWQGSLQLLRAGLWIELLGVLVVSIVESYIPLPYASAWSHYGSGYVWLPLVLPISGIVLSYRHTATAPTHRV